jgi:holliday junction DNA helicase RuvA
VIDRVEGKVLERAPGHVVVGCNGVGYRLNTSAQTLEAVPPVGRNVELLAHLILRDDGIHLYGFATAAERELFLRLISVSGIGPKMALAALSGSTTEEMRAAIAAGDAKRFQVVPGIGKKTAERVIVELREVYAADLVAAPPGPQQVPGSAIAVAREGLVSLGYDAGEAETMLRALAPELVDAGEPEELISAALRMAVRAA